MTDEEAPQGQEDEQKVMRHVHEVQIRYQEWLMRKSHVVGVAAGVKCTRGEETGRLCLVVMVDEKVKEEELSPEDRIPEEIDGVLVDVQEMGGMFTAF